MICPDCKNKVLILFMESPRIDKHTGQILNDSDRRICEDCILLKYGKTFKQVLLERERKLK